MPLVLTILAVALLAFGAWQDTRSETPTLEDAWAAFLTELVA